jgi:hypothetical protein
MLPVSIGTKFLGLMMFAGLSMVALMGCGEDGYSYNNYSQAYNAYPPGYRYSYAPGYNYNANPRYGYNSYSQAYGRQPERSGVAQRSDVQGEAHRDTASRVNAPRASQSRDAHQVAARPDQR